MNDNIFSFILIPLVVFIVSLVARYIRHKLAEPKFDEGVQKPGGFDRFLLYFITLLAFFSVLFTALGFMMQETEMGIVFLFLTLIFVGIVLLLRREYNIAYRETEEYFILNRKNEEFKVYYENIIDWQPAFNEIWILDKSRADDSYVKVNIAMLKPEILLQRIIEMTAAGKFQQRNNLPGDPRRQTEIVNHLIQHHYGHLVKDYIEK